MNINKFIGRKDEESRKRVLLLLVIAIICMLAGLLWGISNNFIGPLLFITGLGLLVLSFFLNWASVRVFIYLLIGSSLAFGLFTLLHNLLYGLAERYSEVVSLHTVLDGLHGFFFLLSVLLCPAAFIASIVGLLLRAFQRFN